MFLSYVFALMLTVCTEAQLASLRGLNIAAVDEFTATVQQRLSDRRANAVLTTSSAEMTSAHDESLAVPVSLAATAPMDSYLIYQTWFSTTTCSGPPLIELIAFNKCIYADNSKTPYVKYVKTSITSYNSTYYSDSKCAKPIAGKNTANPFIQSCVGGSGSSAKVLFSPNISSAAALLTPYGTQAWAVQGFFAGQCQLSSAGVLSEYLFPIGVCLGGVKFNSCSGSKLSLTSYKSNGCTGTTKPQSIDVPTCLPQGKPSNYNMGLACINA